MNKRNPIYCFIALLATALMCLNVAVAKGPSAKVTVTNANPGSAIRGEAVTVVISGSGFDHGSKVRFLVTGTNDDTQINVVDVDDSEAADGNLTASIQVLSTATVIDYDIEVMNSRGRRGKGTTLFKVKQEETVVYTAELTLGGFVFDPVDVTFNHVDNSLRGESTLQMIHPVDSGFEQVTWNEVFDPCLLLPDGVDSFRVGAINWKIVNSGGSDGLVLIRMNDLDIAPDPVDMTVEIGFQLAGRVEAGDGPFLPVSTGDESFFTLTDFWLQGDAKRGRTCRGEKGKHPGSIPLILPSELVITRK